MLIAGLVAVESNPLGAVGGVLPKPPPPKLLGAGVKPPVEEPNPLAAGAPNAGAPPGCEPYPPLFIPPNPPVLMLLPNGMLPYPPATFPVILTFCVDVDEVDVGFAAVPASFSCVRPNAEIPNTAPIAM